MIDKIVDISKKYIALAKDLKPDFASRNIAKYTDKNYVLIGMRRLGKTEYLKYRIKQSKLKDDQIIYINFDSTLLTGIDFVNKGKKYDEFIQALVSILSTGQIKLVLFDEIQRIKDWSRILKGMIDEYPKITFCATGSDALDLSTSTETGVGRYNIIYVGPLLYKEVKSIKPKIKLEDYINFYSFPQGKEFDYQERYQAVIEKQVSVSNLKQINVDALLKAIALNPGIKLTRHKLSSIIKDISDSKMDNKQVDSVIDFLVKSNIIISIKDIESDTKATKDTTYTLYPYDWSMFAIYEPTKSYEKLESKINGNNEIKELPTKGFVFENMIISNVYSSLRTTLDKNRIFNKVSEPDIDFILNKKPYEIKSFDVFKSSIETQAKIVSKAKITNASIIHLGESKIVNDVQYINWEEFLMGL